jgi:hypothetical protein
MNQYLFGAAQACDPFLQDCLLVMLDTSEGDSHAHVGQDKNHFAKCGECGVFMGDPDANVGILRGGIEHVEEASVDAQVADLGD